MKDNETRYISGMLHRTQLYFDERALEKVRNTTFAISGLGGVGAITAELLARWGVRKFRLLDMDRYEPSNLNRQLFATSSSLGRYKVDVAAERIREINPFAEIEMGLSERVTNENVHRFVQGAGMVVQNADYPSCKLFYLAARLHKVPLVNGYATVTGGRVQAFDYHRSPCSNALDTWWKRFKFGDERALEEKSAAEIAEFDRRHVHSTAPSINFVTNQVGCIVVAEAIKLLTGRGRAVIYPRYLSFDAFTCKMKVRNSNSFFNIENFKRLCAVIASKYGGSERSASSPGRNAILSQREESAKR